jgi:agmatinase
MFEDFNPDINIGSGIFGLPHSADEALIHIIPVPWDLTASYRKGSANGPLAIYNASFQLDLFRDYAPEFWKSGIYISEISDTLKKAGQDLIEDVEIVVKAYNEGRISEKDMSEYLVRINDACFRMNQYVYDHSLNIINNKRIPVVLGGDHSVPLGLITALSETNESFGILQIDAHADLRKGYQGFMFSHASIMFNALNLNSVSQLVQVGVRDYCIEENHRIRNSRGRIICYSDRYLQHEQFEGTPWQEMAAGIISSLPARVYVSFDIDGLNPLYCPNTGTPVPGGPSLEQITFLLEGICESGRIIIGADLCEVAPDPNGQNEWDANVGARALLDLCMYIIQSNKR